MTTLELSHVGKRFTVRDRGRRQTLYAVDDVSFTLHSGQTTALVGESGSGKSTIVRMLARLTKPTSGEIRLDETVVRGGPRAVRRYRSDVQMVFQDPFGSLNPTHTVGYHLQRPLRLHGVASDGRSARDGVLELLDRVNLTPPERVIDRYPHELSGGQRQRVAIARALAPRPKVLLADEPVSMLDVSIRLEILDLIDTLKQQEDLAVLYVTHDLATARYFASSIMVLYRGQVVESGSSDEVILRPAHPYTQVLAEAAPDPARPRLVDPGARRSLHGSSQRSADRPGCLFRSRCPSAMNICEQPVPTFPVGAVGAAGAAGPAGPVGAAGPVGSGGLAPHVARCWLLDPETDRTGDAGQAVARGA
jgi:peptide/nickel transport system ATP-binding protein